MTEHFSVSPAPVRTGANIQFGAFNLHSVCTIFLVFLTITFGFAPDAFAAEEIVDPVRRMYFPAGQVFTYLFLMLGPFKIIGPFSKITQGADGALTRRIALRASIFGGIALLLAAFIGEYIVRKYGVPLPILSLAAGIILFLVALMSILQEYSTLDGLGESSAPVAEPDLKLALTPLAFPTIVTPYGIAALVIFLAAADRLQEQLTIAFIVAVIMVLNLIAMFASKHIPAVLGVFLFILGAVLGIIQVGLGLQIMSNSLKALSIL